MAEGGDGLVAKPPEARLGATAGVWPEKQAEKKVEFPLATAARLIEGMGWEREGPTGERASGEGGRQRQAPERRFGSQGRWFSLTGDAGSILASVGQEGGLK